MKVPKLRFKEFSDQWEKRILGDIFTFKNGVNASKEQYGSGFKFINVLDIINNNFITYENILGSVNITEEEFTKNEVKYGDVLFQRSSETREEVGQSNVYIGNRPVTFGGFVIRGRGITKYDPIFFNYILKTDSVRDEITQRSGGSTRYNIGQEALNVVTILLPTIPEQTKIASFLTAIDEKITQLTQKCDLLAQYKKGVMQQIFSQKLRFKDDDGREFPEWVEKNMGDTLSIFSGYAFSSNYSQSYGIKWLKIADVGIQKMTPDSPSYLPSELRDKHKNFLVYKDDYVIALTRPILNGELKIARIDQYYDGSLLNQRVGKLVSNEVINFVYFLLQLKNTVSQITDTISGTDPPNLSLNEIKGIKLKIPSDRAEQTKIANFLTAIDDKITQAQAQLEAVKRYKKGLLQQMFV